MKTKYKYTYEHNCENCGKKFTSNKPSTKVCSDACSLEQQIRKTTKYTPEVVQEISDLRGAGMTVDDISEKMNINSATIKNIMSKNNIHLSEENKAVNIARRWAGHNPWINGTQLECTTCKAIKEKECFNKRKTSATGYAGSCKDCVNLYYKKNSEPLKEKAKKYGQEHKEEISKRNKENYKNKKETNESNKKED